MGEVGEVGEEGGGGGGREGVKTKLTLHAVSGWTRSG